MKITAFNGSPKGAKGNTNLIVEEFLAGARDAGAETENVQLADKRIEPCIGCFACWIKTPGKCVHDDDQAALLEKVLASDINVYATPLYVDNVSGIMKHFLDRSIPVIDPHFITDEFGETVHPPRFEKARNIAVISNCGFPEQSHFQVLKLLFRRMARNMRCELVAEIYRGGGAMLTVQVPQLKPIIDGYKALVRQAGAEVATKGRLSAETSQKLETPLIPSEMYSSFVNQSWDEHGRLKGER